MKIVALASVAVALLAVPAAAGTKSFTDAAGDGAGGPDLTDVAVSSTAAGRLRFRVGLANGLGGGTVSVLVDADGDLATGHSDGVEATLTYASSSGLQVERWNGTTFETITTDASASEPGGAVLLDVRASDLEVRGAFGFAVIAYEGAALDQAPEGSFRPRPDTVHWTFDPAFASMARAVRVTFAPARPKAGRRFGVRAATLTLATGASVRARTLRCAATLAGRPLRGSCRWRLPASARGERLTIRVTAAAGAARATKTSAFAVR